MRRRLATYEYLAEMQTCERTKRYAIILMWIQIVAGIVLLSHYEDILTHLFQDAVLRRTCIGLWWIAVVVLGAFHMNANSRLDLIKVALSLKGVEYKRQHGKEPPKDWLPEYIDVDLD